MVDGYKGGTKSLLSRPSKLRGNHALADRLPTFAPLRDLRAQDGLREDADVRNDKRQTSISQTLDRQAPSIPLVNSSCLALPKHPVNVEVKGSVQSQKGWLPSQTRSNVPSGPQTRRGHTSSAHRLPRDKVALRKSADMCYNDEGTTSGRDRTGEQEKEGRTSSMGSCLRM